MADDSSNARVQATDSTPPGQQSDQPDSTSSSQFNGVGSAIAGQAEASQQFNIPCSTVCTTSERLAAVIHAYSQSIHDDGAANHPPPIASDNRENEGWRAAFDADFRSSLVRIMAKFITPDLHPSFYNHQRVIDYFEALCRLENSIWTTSPSMEAYYRLLFRVCREIRRDHGESDQT